MEMSDRRESSSNCVRLASKTMSGCISVSRSNGSAISRAMTNSDGIRSDPTLPVSNTKVWLSKSGMSDGVST